MSAATAATNSITSASALASQSSTIFQKLITSPLPPFGFIACGADHTTSGLPVIRELASPLRIVALRRRDGATIRDHAESKSNGSPRDRLTD
jgi:hypothetical protein